MAFFVDNGAAVWVDWDTPEHKARMKLGQSYYGTLAGCALYEGVEVTAFDKAVKAEPVYNGFEALATYPKLPDPVGVEASYRVVVMNGKHFHPPLHPADAKKLAD